MLEEDDALAAETACEEDEDGAGLESFAGAGVVDGFADLAGRVLIWCSMRFDSRCGQDIGLFWTELLGPPPGALVAPNEAFQQPQNISLQCRTSVYHVPSSAWPHLQLGRTFWLSVCDEGHFARPCRTSSSCARPCWAHSKTWQMC